MTTSSLDSTEVDNAIGAKYHSLRIPHLQNNPFIEALPPILSGADIYRMLRKDIPYRKKDRMLLPEEREYLIYHARNFFKPYERVIRLAKSIFILIRDGYATRPSPLEKGYMQKKANAQSIHITLLGISGGGKTYTVENIISLMPQVIKHSKYKDHPLLVYQIVWLKINCPVDGTVKGLCLSVLQEIDYLLGTEYYRDYGKNGAASQDALKEAIRKLVRIHGIGCLIIDEIQYLTAARGKCKEELINFIVELENWIGLPIIKIGTYKAQHLFSEFREGRRACGLVPPYWDRLDNDDEWKSFIKALWKYQYTAKATPYSDEFAGILYDISQGIIDLAVKAYLLAQFRAIDDETEEITKDLLYSIAKDHFQPANKILYFLRTNNLDGLKSCGDIYIDFDEALRKIKENSTNQPKSRGKKASTPPVTTANAGDDADKSAKNTKRAKKGEYTKDELDNLATDDLRRIVANARIMRLSAYDELKKAGYIKHPSEFQNFQSPG